MIKFFFHGREFQVTKCEKKKPEDSFLIWRAVYI